MTRTLEGSQSALAVCQLSSLHYIVKRRRPRFVGGGGYRNFVDWLIDWWLIDFLFPNAGWSSASGGFSYRFR